MDDRTVSEMLLDMHIRYREWRDRETGDSPDAVGFRCAMTNVCNDISRELGERAEAIRKQSGE